MNVLERSYPNYKNNSKWHKARANRTILRSSEVNASARHELLSASLSGGCSANAVPPCASAQDQARVAFRQKFSVLQCSTNKALFTLLINSGHNLMHAQYQQWDHGPLTPWCRPTGSRPASRTPTSSRRVSGPPRSWACRRSGRRGAATTAKFSWDLV